MSDDAPYVSAYLRRRLRSLAEVLRQRAERPAEPTDGDGTDESRPASGREPDDGDTER